MNQTHIHFLITHFPIFHRPAVVIHRPPVVVHRPDIIYHQSPVVFDTPPPKLHTDVIKQHDNYVMKPVLQQVASRVQHNTGLVHGAQPLLHHEGAAVVNNEAAAPIHVMASQTGHTGTAVVNEAPLANHVATGQVVGTDGAEAVPAEGQVAGDEPWPVEAGSQVTGAPARVAADGAHAQILDGGNGVVGAQSSLLDAGPGAVADDGEGAVVEDNQGAVLNNGRVLNTHGAVLNAAHPSAVLSNGAQVVEGHRTVLTGRQAAVAGTNGAVVGGDEVQQDDGAYVPEEEPAKSEVVVGSARPAPVLNGQHIKVVVDGRNAPTTQRGVALDGVDNSQELTNAATATADEAADNASEPVAVEAKEDGEPIEAKEEDPQVSVGNAAVEAARAEPEDAEHDGDRAAAPETAADNKHFSTEAKDDGDVKSIEAKQEEADDVREETAAPLQRVATARPVRVQQQVRAQQQLSPALAPARVSAAAVAAANTDDQMIQDNSLLTSNEPEADGTAPAPEAVTAAHEPAGDAEGEVEARDKTAAVPANEKHESGLGKSTVAKSVEAKKDTKKEKKEKKKSKVAKKKSDEVAKTRKKRDSQLSKLSIYKRSVPITKEETKKEKIARGKKNKKRSKTPKHQPTNEGKKRRKSKKNDIVVKRPPVIYHPPPEIYHRPPIIVHRPPLVIRRPPIIYHQPPVIVHRPAVVYHQPPLVFHQPPPAVSQPILKSHDTFMMHPAAHLTHMGSMVTNAGTYVGVPEHRFMYQSGMGFLHAPGGGGGPGVQDGGVPPNGGAPNMQYQGGAEEHHEAEGEHAMPQEMEAGAGGPSPEGDFHPGDEHAGMNGGTQQIVDQAMNENDQGMGGAPDNGASEMVEQQNGQQQGVENPNGGGFPNEAAYGRNEVPGDNGGMLKKDNSAGNPAEQSYKSQNNKRKSIPKGEEGPIPVDDASKRSTTAESPRSKRQVDGMYSPYPMQQQQYPYAQEMNNNEQSFFNRAPKHHRRTTVNVDVVGKREVSITDEPAVPKSTTPFLV